MHNHTGKTKTAMLLELESIKDLLIEDGDIPTLQEVVLPETVLSKIVLDNVIQQPLNLAVQPIVLEETIVLDYPTLSSIQPATSFVNHEEEQIPILVQTLEVPDINITHQPTATITTLETIAPVVSDTSSILHQPEQQQDFFPLSITEVLPKPTLDIITESEIDIQNTKSTSATLTTPSIKSTSQRTAPIIKASGQNPFLPEHIRARLHGNNSSPTPTEINSRTSNVSRFSTSTTNTSSVSLAKKPSQHQQLINDVMDDLLPAIEKELRGRLETMSKKMLEDLLVEHK